MKFSFTPAQFVTPSPVPWSLLGYKLFSGASSELPSVEACAIDHHPGFFSFFLASLSQTEPQAQTTHQSTARLQEGEGGRDKR